MPKADLSNWRVAPHSQWAFQHVRELIPSANISACSDVRRFGREVNHALGQTSVPGINQTVTTLIQFLEQTSTDAFMLLREGKVVYEWAAPHCDSQQPHIVFSVSKSITAMLAGVLVEKGLLDVDGLVADYLPQTADSVYGECTLQHVLDMAVSADFEEAYLDPTGAFARYRNATGWNPVNQNDAGHDLKSFLMSLQTNGQPHGEVFQYKSPNTDLLGWILEEVADKPYAELLSDTIWQPIKAVSDAYVTVDRNGTARAAGGICATLHDLACFGEMVRNKGKVDGKTVVAQGWVEDTINNGKQSAWQQGNFSYLMPNGNYRNQWYQTGNNHKAFCALGIHGQWIYIDPVASTIIVKLSSQANPLNDELDIATLGVFDWLCQYT